MKVEFYRHDLSETEMTALGEVMNSPFLTAGPKTTEFEAKFAQYLGVKHCAGLMSCTAGLFLALKAMNIGPGDEVIVPAMTFIASANVVLHCGANPVLVDVEPDTGVIDVDAAARAVTERTRAIIPVHLYGQMADMKALRSLADEYGLVLIEDAAHAIESRRDGYQTGQIGDACAFSFYATKNITCGEGGALVTNDARMNERVRILRQHGMSKSAADRYHGKYQHWDMIDLGFKFNMFDIQAAMLLPQFEKMEKNLRRREEICSYYEKEFRAAGVDFPIVRPGSRSARHMFTVWAPRGQRDDILKTLQEKEIGVAVNYRAIHLLTYYRDHFGYKEGMLPNAEMIGDRTLTIPLYPKLTDAEVEYVAKSVIEAHKHKLKKCG
jgi:dTDP-4-amino-4,6-dideoxygalactose transaminase